jgi:hypothetical protein
MNESDLKKNEEMNESDFQICYDCACHIYNQRSSKNKFELSIKKKLF